MQTRRWSVLIAGTVLCLCAACRKEPPKPAPSPEKTAAPAALPPKPAPPPRPPYRAVPIEGMQSVIELISELGKEGFGLVLKINRVDLDHVRQGEALVVPAKVADLLYHSPFPP